MGQDFSDNKIIKHLYFHIPFCLERCDYCSFFSTVFKSSEDTEKYIKYLLEELKFYQKQFYLLPETVYFGGGTPSLLQTKQLKTIIECLDLCKSYEITIETNPLSCVDKNVFKVWKDIGFNRVSIGAQSFIDKELRLLGRNHSVKDIYKTYEWLLKVGLDNISLDFIFGLPEQSKRDILFNLDRITELEPRHISTYCLSVDKKLPLYRLKDSFINDEKAAEYYHLIREYLTYKGYNHYELSNYSERSFESKHNLAYWNQIPYLGIGAGASGYVDNYRYRNPESLNDYYDKLDLKDFFNNKDYLDKKVQEFEFIFLSLRKVGGLDKKKFKQKFETEFDIKYSQQISKLKKMKLISDSKKLMKLTKKAYFISDEIFQEFL